MPEAPVTLLRRRPIKHPILQPACQLLCFLFIRHPVSVSHELEGAREDTGRIVLEQKVRTTAVSLRHTNPSRQTFQEPVPGTLIKPQALLILLWVAWIVTEVMPEVQLITTGTL